MTYTVALHKAFVTALLHNANTKRLPTHYNHYLLNASPEKRIKRLPSQYLNVDCKNDKGIGIQDHGVFIQSPDITTMQSNFHRAQSYA